MTRRALTRFLCAAVITILAAKPASGVPLETPPEKLGPKAQIKRALREPGITIVTLRPRPISEKMKTALAAASVAGKSADENPPAYFLVNQMLAEMTVTSVIRNGTGGKLPPVIYVAGAQSGARVFRSENHRLESITEAPLHVLPRLDQRDVSWLAFLVPVRTGAELPDGDRAARHFKHLSKRAVFTNNLFVLYGGSSAFEIAAPEKAKQDVFKVDVDFLVDLALIEKELAPAKKEAAPSKARIQSTKGRVSTPLGKDILTLLELSVK